MIGERLRGKCFNRGYPNELWSSLSSRPTRIRRPLCTGARVVTVNNSECEFYLDEQIRPPLLKHVVDAQYAEAPVDRVCDSHKIDNELVHFGF